MKSPVILVERSGNRKLSTNRHMSTTYASQVTCPSTCPFRGHGCYAECTMHVKAVVNRLDQSRSVEDTAIIEATHMIFASGKYPLRLHTVGDCYNTKCAEHVAWGAHAYHIKHDQPVWTYTHNHRIPRKAWGVISVLRSCETVRQAECSIKAGFGAALVVPQFKSDKSYYLGRGLRGIPCPVQTDKTTSCSECRLCWDADRLCRTKSVILFEPHGSGKKMINRVIRGVK